MSMMVPMSKQKLLVRVALVALILFGLHQVIHYSFMVQRPMDTKSSQSSMNGFSSLILSADTQSVASDSDSNKEEEEHERLSTNRESITEQQQQVALSNNGKEGDTVMPLRQWGEVGRDCSDGQCSMDQSGQDSADIVKGDTVNYEQLNNIRKPCGVHLERNSHFVNRELWQSLSASDLAEKSDELERYIKDELPRFNYDKYGYSGYGIVFAASGGSLKRCLVSVNLLKQHHRTSLPIEVWYISGELDREQLDLLVKAGAEPRDVVVEAAKFPELNFQISHSYGSSRNYQIKSMILLLTKFQHVIYMDSDNNALRDPAILFQHEAYKATGAIFWKDFWKFPYDNPIWKIIRQECHDEFEQESGQLVIDKQRSWQSLLLATYLQMEHKFYFTILLGDKDTFRLAWKVLNQPYHYIENPPAMAGRVRQGRFCGHSMVQFGPDGKLMFVHANAMKSANAIKRGNTWESIKYLQPQDPTQITPVNGTDQLSIISGYPVTNEYQGGPERPLEEGGMGQEVLNNPCFDYSIQTVAIDTSYAVIDALGAQKAVDSYRSILEPWVSYANGSFAWFEDKYYDLGGPGSGNAQYCGQGNIGNGECRDSSLCCSSSGWCDNSIDHCGIGCQGGFCFQSRTLPVRLGPEFEYCGNGIVGYGVCQDPNACCSRFGYCGSSVSHCSREICINGPCLTH
ncbi:hypothetical protein MP228_007803 [Amoeboaphelidium protococcarum]|nr:hypothetical protein MP228_007803 [Amoeboaphelidium protococcarum]